MMQGIREIGWDNQSSLTWNSLGNCCIREAWEYFGVIPYWEVDLKALGVGSWELGRGRFN